jgi:hypothetical protein
MISDLDIYRAANLLIDRYGDDALTEAARRIDRMLASGDSEGRVVFGSALGGDRGVADGPEQASALGDEPSGSAGRRERQAEAKSAR